MPWSGSSPNQTFGRTDGTRTGATTWQEADGAGVDIIATDHDTHDQDLAGGINAALKKDGGNSPSANLPMAGFRHTNVAVATALTHYLSATQAFQSVGTHVATVGGTANAVTLTTGFSLTAYTEGMTFTWKVPTAITGPMTVNVDGIGAKSVLTLDGAELENGEIRVDFIPIITYDGIRFRWLNRPTSGSSGDVLGRITPVGIVAPWPGSTAPSGWLFAYGQAVSRTTYAELFTAYGTTYGVGDGSTTFNLPDYRGRSPFGRDDMGGSAASRVTTAGSSVDGATLGAVGGAQNVTLTSAQMPVHSHSVTDPGHAHSINLFAITQGTGSSAVVAGNSSGSGSTGLATTGISIGNAGSGSAHTNMPPAIVQNWIILALPALASAANLGVNGFFYRFSSSTSGDPGTGKIGFNHATIASATGFLISETDASGAPVGPVLATWDDSTSTVRGTLYVYKVGQISTYALFKVTGTLTDSGTYDSFSATYVSANGTFADGDQLSVLFTATGDASTVAGPTGSPGVNPALDYTWSTATSGDPGSGKLLVNNATPASATQLNISETNRQSASQGAYLATWDDSTTSSNKGVIRIVDLAAPGTNYLEYRITGSITDVGSYDTFPVTYIGGAGTIADATTVAVAFYATGDKGADGAGTGDVVGPAASVDSEIALYSSTTGKLIKRATLTGLVKATSGVASAATAGTDYYAPGSTDVAIADGGTNASTAYAGYDNLSIRGADIASASTINLTTATGNLVDVTGTTTITDITLSDGYERTVRFTGILTLTHGASLVLPSGASITTAAGDFAVFRGYAAGVVRCVLYTKADGTAVVGGSGASAGTGLISASGSLYVQQLQPGGRLTLTSGTPVLTSDAAAQTTIYYAPFVHGFIPVYNGTDMRLYSILGSTTDAVGLSLAMAGSANWASGSVYDLFYAYVSGVLYFGTGPAWSSTTSRGTGAGTTELQRYNGIWTNKVSMTLRNAAGTQTVPANQGTLLGSFYASANGTTTIEFGGIGASGAAAKMYLANQYNRQQWIGFIGDSTDSWTYNSTTVRAANGSSTMRANYIACMNDFFVEGLYTIQCETNGSNGITTGMDQDSTTTFGDCGNFHPANSIRSVDVSAASWPAGLGVHYISANEVCANAFGAVTVYGDNGTPASRQGGMTAKGLF